MSDLKIDSTARIAAGANIGRDVSIGPYCVIGADVVIGEGCRIASHVNITGRTTIGARVKIAPFVSLGTPPQSVHYKGEDTELVIGAGCDIREYVTMNIGTGDGRGVTRVGENCMFMVSSHVAHDCIVGDHVTLANYVPLAGFAEVGDHVFFGGMSGIHQFRRVGTGAMIGGLSGVTLDVIPFGIVMGLRASLRGLNRVGLRRRGCSGADIQAIYKAYRAIFFGAGTITERVDAAAKDFAGNAHVMEMIAFIRAGDIKKLMRPATAEDPE